jgi:hypothetical protein
LVDEGILFMYVQMDCGRWWIFFVKGRFASCFVGDSLVLNTDGDCIGIFNASLRAGMKVDEFMLLHEYISQLMQAVFAAWHALGCCCRNILCWPDIMVDNRFGSSLSSEAQAKLATCFMWQCDFISYDDFLPMNDCGVIDGGWLDLFA